jgi:hypothetical protein
MARYAFDNQMAQMTGAPPVRSGGGWRALFWYMIAAAGVGFAGYMFLIPYQRVQSALITRTGEVSVERRSAEEAGAERDKLKTDLAKYTAADKEKAATDGKKKAALDGMITTLRPSLEELGATVTADGSLLSVSFPAAKVIDPNGIDVSEGGMAALRILAGSVKSASGHVRIKARASSAAPPRELKGLFHSAGEMQAVRAARVMSALEDAGIAPDALTIVGEPEKPTPRARGKKGAPADRLDIQVEPE